MINKYLYLIIGLCFVSALTSQVPDYVPTQGLLGWWPLDGNANDESENQNHGTVDGATAALNRYDESGKAFEFDGVDDEINFEVKQVLNFSVSVWHKPIEDEVVRDPIFQLRKDCIQTGYDRNGHAYLGTYFLDGKVNIGYKYMPRDCSQAGSFYSGLVDGTYSTFSSWSHYVMTRNDSTEELIIYYNGKKIFDGSTWIQFTAEGNEFLRLGKLWENKNSYTWSSCYTDDLGYWDRVLDSNEVKALYLSKKCDSRFIVNPKDTSVSGDIVTFECELNDSTATYSWQTNQGLGWLELSNAGQYSGVNTKTLTVSNVNISNDNQLFRCLAQSGCGRDTTREAKLIVIPVNRIESVNRVYQISPNPTNGLISVNGIVGKENYSIYSLNGKEITTGVTQGIIDISYLTAGVYLLRMNGFEFKVNKLD